MTWARRLLRRPDDLHHVPLPLGRRLEGPRPIGYHIDFRGKAPTPDFRPPPDPTRTMWTTIVQWGLGCFEHHAHGGGHEWLDAGLAATDHLVRAQRLHGEHRGAWVYGYPFPHTFPLEPPWTNAMTQGEGASLLVRAALATGRATYADRATMALEPLFRPVTERGGTTGELPGGGPLLQEYPTDPPPHVLNGAIFALWGLHDVHQAFADESAGRRFHICADALAGALPLWDLGYWSRYDLFPHARTNVASAFYHRLHITQLQAWERLSHDDRIVATRRRLEAYERCPDYRLRALLAKVAFRLASPRSPALQRVVRRRSAAK